MNLASCQTQFAAALASSSLFSGALLSVWNPLLPANGTGIVIDDNSGKAGQGAADALARGLCIVVGPPKKGQKTDSVDGASAFRVLIPVTVIENPEQNFRELHGTRIGTLEAMDEVIRRISKLNPGLTVQRNPAPENFDLGELKEGQMQSRIVFSVAMFWT